MLKWLVLAQALIYLLLMPILRSSVDILYRPPLGAGLLAIVSLVAGFGIVKLRGEIGMPVAGPVSNRLRPRRYLSFAIVTLVLLYAWATIRFGLLNRRQGSEFMAELYADLPIYALAIVRGYEILFIPFVLFYAFGGSAGRYEGRVVAIALFASLPFMGVADSRGRLIVLALYMLCFVRVDTFIKFFYRYVRFYIAACVVFGAFIFYSYQRSSSYNSFNEYLLVEVYQRLDGLNLVTDLRDAGLIDKIGQYDFAMLGPLVSKVPFIEAARVAKMMGRTSTKQYYLRDLLGREQLDAANSMIADPLYFAGWLGVIVAFCLLGYVIARIDRFIARDGLFRDSMKSAIVIAFVTSFAVIENDFLGACLTFLQNLILVSLLFVVGTTRPRPASSTTSQR